MNLFTTVSIQRLFNLQIANDIEDTGFDLLAEAKIWVAKLFDLASPDKAEIRDIVAAILLSILVIGVAILVNFITKKLILAIIHKLVEKSKTTWDDKLLEKKVFHRLSHIAPAILLYYANDIVLADFPGWLYFIETVTYLYMLSICLSVIFAFLDAVNEIYQTLPRSKDRSIKPFIQVVKVLVAVFVGIAIVSILFNKNPLTIVAGMGVFVTALMFLFKDTLLGLVGGIQLASNDMIRPGDWIAMPSRGADGTVTEITLNTVKVQNWDKTVTTIPTYSLITESFKNWRGMEESGGRRICRNINIDLQSIQFCTPEMIERFRKYELITKYIDWRLKEVEEYNNARNIDPEIKVNGRRITNIGTFRKYVEEYLRANENIHQEGMTFLVRQLEPSELGLPIQIYVFSKVQSWVEYEAIQADIFDHILSVIPEFGLRLFQNPTGHDFRKLGGE